MSDDTLRNVPAELRELRQWVAYKAFPSKTRPGKTDKVPVNPTTGENASSTDPATWGTFEAALSRAKRDRLAGIGFVFTQDDPYTGIDFDDVIDADGNVEQWVLDCLWRCNSYAERSRSRTGVHIIARGNLPPGGRKHGPVEMYDSARFFVFTGDMLPGYNTIRNAQEAIDLIHREQFSTPSPKAELVSQPAQPVNLDDAELIAKATDAKNGNKFHALWHGNVTGYGSQSEADLAFCSYLAFWTGGDAGRVDSLFRQSGLYRDKWDRRHYADGRTYGQATIEKALGTVREVYDGNGRQPPDLDLIQTDKLEPPDWLEAVGLGLGDMPSITTSRTNGRSKIGAERSAAKPQPTARPTVGKRPPVPTDDELAARWLAAHPDTGWGLGEFRRYENGLWPVVPLDVIRREIKDVLEAAKVDGVRPTARLLNSVMELGRIEIAQPPQVWDADHDILICKNGALHIPTRTLQPHSQEHYATSGLPYDYDPEAKATTWEHVLNSCVPDAREFLQEFAGYALTTDTRFEVALWLAGQPGGGKSTILEGLRAMLGPRVCLVGLSDIEKSRFALTDLPGKTLAISTEQPGGFVDAAQKLNAIISGEPVTVDRKFRDAVTIIPRVKFAWAMNELPRVGSADVGLFRRVKVVTLPPIPERDRDPQVKELVKQEGAGILNWALVGLARLRERGRFAIPQVVQEATEDFRETNDVPATFVRECCITGKDKDPHTGKPYRTQGSVLYEAYSEWCKANGHKPASSTSVAEDWRRLGFTKRMIGGKNWWEGVGVTADV